MPCAVFLHLFPSVSGLGSGERGTSVIVLIIWVESRILPGKREILQAHRPTIPHLRYSDLKLLTCIDIGE